MRWHQIIKESNIPKARQDPLANPKFKAWFGNSKVVDAHGNPMCVYHGTTGDFDTFLHNAGNGSGSREGMLGFWFTDHPTVASDFAEWASRNYDPSIVLPVYLKIQNPFVAINYDEIRDLVDKFTTFANPGLRMVTDKVDYGKLRQWLQEQGHDGIILPDTLTDSPDGKTKITQYVIFNSNQVKSAVGNKGTFDDTNPKITENNIVLQTGLYVPAIQITPKSFKDDGLMRDLGINESITTNRTVYHVTRLANLKKIMTSGLTPKIGRRSKSLGESTPAIYFFPDLDALEYAAMNWLGDEFSETTKLVALKVEIPQNIEIFSDVEYECHVYEPISPSDIRIMRGIL